MAQTSIPVGSALARKHFGVALFGAGQRQPTLLNNMTGPAPKQAQAESRAKGQSVPDYPIIRVTDLSKAQGDAVSVDLFNIIGGKPLVGDINAEGRGERLTSSSMDIRVDLMTKVVDAGGKMTQQRTVHNLRGMALAHLGGYMPRLETQQMLVHLAGARGSQQGSDWVVPLTTDPDYTSIMVNTVRAPTFNRHFVANGTGLTQGGAQLGSIATTDVLRLSHIDRLREFIDDQEVQLPPIRLNDDPAKDDEPLFMLLLSPRLFHSLLTDLTANNNIRAFQQNAWNRASYGSKSPLFRGDVGMWNGILVRKMPRAIRFLAAETTPIITQANRFAATETNATIPAIGATRAVERGLLLGSQALANVYGRNQGSDYFYSFTERQYNFERNYEAAGEAMNGKAKVRFSLPDGQGNNEPTDLGVFAVDAVVNL